MAKEILAGVFAVVILLKLIIGIMNPRAWMAGVAWLLQHQALLLGLYLVVTVITGYYALSSLDLIDVAVVMFFTSMLMALGLVPFSQLLLSLGQQFASQGLGQAWPAAVPWAAVAVAVLYRLISGSRGLPGKE